MPSRARLLIDEDLFFQNLAAKAAGDLEKEWAEQDAEQSLDPSEVPEARAELEPHGLTLDETGCLKATEPDPKPCPLCGAKCRWVEVEIDGFPPYKKTMVNHPHRPESLPWSRERHGDCPLTSTWGVVPWQTRPAPEETELEPVITLDENVRLVATRPFRKESS